MGNQIADSLIFSENNFFKLRPEASLSLLFIRFSSLENTPKTLWIDDIWPSAKWNVYVSKICSLQALSYSWKMCELQKCGKSKNSSNVLLGFWAFEQVVSSFNPFLWSCNCYVRMKFFIGGQLWLIGCRWSYSNLLPIKFCYKSRAYQYYSCNQS